MSRIEAVDNFLAIAKDEVVDREAQTPLQTNVGGILKNFMKPIVSQAEGVITSIGSKIKEQSQISEGKKSKEEDGGKRSNKKKKGLFKKVKILNVFKKEAEEEEPDRWYTPFVKKFDEFTTMPWRVRITAFSITIFIGVFFIAISLFFLSNLFVVLFSICYSLGNFLVLLSTFFLLGVSTQMKNLVQKHRLIPFLIYITTLFLTLLISFWQKNAVLSFVMIVVQSVVLGYYLITYFERAYKMFWWLLQRFYSRSNVISEV